MYHTSGEKSISALLILARVDELSAVERSEAKAEAERKPERSRRLVDSKVKPAGGRAERSGVKLSEAELSGAKPAGFTVAKISSAEIDF